jgi:hypothetical protein
MFKATTLFLAAGLAGGACLAQDQQQSKDPAQTMQQMQEIVELRKELKDIKAAKAQPKFYKLEFVLREMEGDRSLNSRTYSMFASTDSPPASIRAVAKMKEGEAGVRLDIRNVRELQNQLGLSLTASVTGVADGSDAARNPVLREFTWSSDVLIPLKKTTVVYSSDSTTSKTQMQVEITAVPVP